MRWLGLVLWGCGGKDAEAPDDPAAVDTDTAEALPDQDGDGSPDDDDCSDSNPDIYPGAVEVCDGLDNDCDGLTDEPDDGLDPDTAILAWIDEDGDGYGLDGTEVLVCTLLSWQALQGGDCDDADSDSHPGAEEQCGDGTDNDCDALIDCEDGDCTPACEEDCGNAADDDADALIDCEDEDCAFDERCIGGELLMVRIQGGTYRQRGVIGSTDGGSYGRWLSNHYHASLSSVSGTVRMLPSTAMRWATATTSTVCTWHLEQATWHGVRNTAFWGSGTVFTADHTRSGFQVSPDCPVTTSGFLPPKVFPVRGTEPAVVAWNAGSSPYGGVCVVGGQCLPRYGRDWYHGAVLSVSSNITTSTQGRYRHYSGTTYSLRLLSPQSSFRFLP